MSPDHPIRAAFAAQARASAALGSRFMGQLMAVCGECLTTRHAVGARILAWEGDVGPAGASVPLRLAGALHGLVLDGSAPDLARLYPPACVSDDALWRAVGGALGEHEQRILDWLDRAPQTNEAGRASAVIAGIWWALGKVGPLPVALSELGASAGLNLGLDHFAVAMDDATYGPKDAALTLTPLWDGEARPTPQPFKVSERRGVDLAPLAPSQPLDRLRLLAYLWPDQTERRARMIAALSVAGAWVDTGDAAPWLKHRLSTARPGALHVVYSTIAAQYFPTSTQAAIAAQLSVAMAAASPEAPLLHFAMEADGQTPGAALTVTLATGAEPLQRRLGRAHFHGDWIAWSPEVEGQAFYPL